MRRVVCASLTVTHEHLVPRALAPTTVRPRIACDHPRDAPPRRSVWSPPPEHGADIVSLAHFDGKACARTGANATPVAERFSAFGSIVLPTALPSAELTLVPMPSPTDAPTTVPSPVPNAVPTSFPHSDGDPHARNTGATPLAERCSVSGTNRHADGLAHRSQCRRLQAPVPSYASVQRSTSVVGLNAEPPVVGPCTEPRLQASVPSCTSVQQPPFGSRPRC